MRRLYSEATTSIERIAERKVQYYLKLAKDNGLKLPKDKNIKLFLKFNLKSIRSAGMAVWKRSKNIMIIRLHPLALSKYKKNYLLTTVPHEVSHIIQFVNFCSSKQHGQQFKKIMRIFDAPPDRCHEYNLGVLRGIKRITFTHKCNCGEHEVSPLIHKRILAGQSRICMKCKGELKI